MNKSCIIITLCFVICFATILNGCGQNGVTYTYKNQDTSAPVVISKSVYLEDELKLYIKDLKGEYDITAFDSDFNPINEEYTSSYKAGVLSIQGNRISDISGLHLDGPCRYHFRFLDSDEYAIIYYMDATDIGWEAFGEFDKYYTAEELAKQQAQRDAETKLQEDNYKTLEGLWRCDADPELYIRVYEKENYGRWLEWNRSAGDGTYYLDDMSIAQININEGYDCLDVVILDDPYWGMCMRFEMSEDKTQIIDYHYDQEDDIYTRYSE